MGAGAGGWPGAAHGSRAGYRAVGALAGPGGRRWHSGLPGRRSVARLALEDLLAAAPAGQTGGAS
eukprot:5665123-Alexandrium_andersonii.AAC.1